MMRMPGESYRGPLIPLTPLETKIKEQLKKDVLYLAGTLGERNIWHEKNYKAAAEYINSAFKKNNLLVTEQKFLSHRVEVTNIIGEKKGVSRPNDIFVIGAHYDSVYGSPGADDNASGVAALISLAQLLKDISLPYTIRFVAFANEESPFFYSSEMGSWQYAKILSHQNESILGMFSLESIGYYSTQKNSQDYPLFFNLFYPSIGDFIGFVANLGSRKLLLQAISSFRKNVNFPSEGIAAPRLLRGVSWSDQWSFWRFGYSAIMITDTALYRNPNYHTEFDLPNTLDYDRFARVVYGLSTVFTNLAQEQKD